jgi:hypothetical protein
MVMTAFQEQVFSNLPISKSFFVDEMAILLIKQQLAEYSMEVDYFEKKYRQTFHTFEINFQQQSVTYEEENDWLSWKFAEESYAYWKNLLLQNP